MSHVKLTKLFILRSKFLDTFKMEKMCCSDCNVLQMFHFTCNRSLSD